MRVRLIAIYAGPRGAFAPGTVLDLPDAEAAALVRGGYAALVVEEEVEAPPRRESEESPVELAVLPDPEETAVTRPGRRRGLR